MKFNKWTLGLAAVGLISLTAAARAADEKFPVRAVFDSHPDLENFKFSGLIEKPDLKFELAVAA